MCWSRPVTVQKNAIPELIKIIFRISGSITRHVRVVVTLSIRSHMCHRTKTVAICHRRELMDFEVKRPVTDLDIPHYKFAISIFDLLILHVVVTVTEPLNAPKRPIRIEHLNFDISRSNSGHIVRHSHTPPSQREHFKNLFQISAK